MIYEMYTGMISEKIVQEKMDLENIPDLEVKDILIYIFGKKIRKKKHPMKVEGSKNLKMSLRYFYKVVAEQFYVMMFQGYGSLSCMCVHTRLSIFPEATFCTTC